MVLCYITHLAGSLFILETVGPPRISSGKARTKFNSLCFFMMAEFTGSPATLEFFFHLLFACLL